MECGCHANVAGYPSFLQNKIMNKIYTEQAKISLIIPTRKRVEMLQNLLDSLREHKWLMRDDVEVLVVDNASDKSTARDLCSCYNSVKYLYVAEPGQRNALNYGIRKASGELLAFVDDDVVVISEDWLYRMAKHFSEHSNLGYVSGNVKALETASRAQEIWEKGGGLSKGQTSVYWSNKEVVNNYRWRPLPLARICVGANSMIPRSVFRKVGLFIPLFDPGAPIPHGGSLEMGYRIIKAGYDLFYDSEAIVLHHHPTTESELQKKLFIYGVGDTAIQAYFFWRYRDYRGIWWALGGYQFYRIYSYVMGQYNFPFLYVFWQMIGGCYGTFLLFFRLAYKDSAKFFKIPLLSEIQD
ncbi:putative glycosyltransferase (plasmid) [Allocoleopsis franciscana PCC 7113]|uniref:Putative glycosyltransferase n=2 Tax=Allocoleopsis TaxID=2886347 RepID=K9WQH1_9CYAN|nr:putative glycosyltransferase [Allocoleopsis franciscana PCC 7113]